jgi:hypothetical protein
MSNTLTGFTSPNVQGAVMKVLRQNAIFPRMATLVQANDGKNVGDTIDLPVTAAIAARDITPAITPAANVDITTTREQLTLSKWQEATFALTDKEARSMRDGVVSEQMQEAVKSIGNAIDTHCWRALYAHQYGYVGTPGTSPFTATSVTVLANAKRVLTKNLAPITDRFFVMDPVSEFNMITVANILQAEQKGDQMGVVEGSLGRILGFNCAVNQNIATLTAALTAWITGWSVSTAAAAAGATTIEAINATAHGVITAGTMFKAAGGLYYSVYTTVTAVTNTNVTLVIGPALVTALASGDALTVVAAYTPNVAFHRSALYFASPVLAGALGAEDESVSTITDPLTGITLRFAVTREYYQSTVRVSSLFGACAPRVGLSINVAG